MGCQSVARKPWHGEVRAFLAASSINKNGTRRCRFLKRLTYAAFTFKRQACSSGSVYPLGCASPLNTSSVAAW